MCIYTLLFTYHILFITQKALKAKFLPRMIGRWTVLRGESLIKCFGSWFLANLFHRFYAAVHRHTYIYFFQPVTLTGNSRGVEVKSLLKFLLIVEGEAPE